MHSQELCKHMEIGAIDSVLSISSWWNSTETLDGVQKLDICDSDRLCDKYSEDEAFNLQERVIGLPSTKWKLANTAVPTLHVHSNDVSNSPLKTQDHRDVVFDAVVTYERYGLLIP